MAYIKYLVSTPERQARTLVRWQKRLPVRYQLKTMLGYDFWWVDGPDGCSVASGKSAKEAIYRALLTIDSSEFEWVEPVRLVVPGVPWVKREGKRSLL